MPYPSALLWVKTETTGLPDGNDFSDVHIMEAAAVVTDFDLNKFSGAHSAVKLTNDHARVLKANPKVLEMHKKSELLQDCAKSEATLRDVELELISVVKDASFDKGEYILAGSGVATYDLPLIREKMPELASWLSPSVIDLGVLRRTVYYFSHRRNFIEKPKEAFDGRTKNRAFDKTIASINEATKYAEWLRGLKEI